ncbi:MAG: ABC transporter substrate-binding protein [Vicinamibacterales bacterium]
MKALAVALMIGIAAGCSGAPDAPPPTAADLSAVAWPEVEAAARGTTVRFAMWAGDEARNRFYEDAVTRDLATRLGITLEIVPLGDTADLVNKLLTEREAGRHTGSVDMVWINGENFRTARQGGLLWGPFAERLPNIHYYDADARDRDFGTPTDGFEAPWQHGQFVFAYDTARVADPPRSLEALRAWIIAHPGRFTYPAPPDFTGSAFVRHVLYLAGGASPAAFQDGFDDALYARTSSRALAWLRDVRPYLWRSGKTYPATPAELDRLFVNGEVDFSMSYGPTFASERIARGEFPPTARTFVLDAGTVFNYSFLAIPFNAPNPGGAMAVINDWLSPAHALARARALGGIVPIPPDRLTPAERAAVDALPIGPATLPVATLAAHRLPEGDAAYLVRLERDWFLEVLRR